MIAVNVIIQDMVKNSKISAWVLLPLVHTSIAKEMPLQLSPRACTLEGDRGAWSPHVFRLERLHDTGQGVESPKLNICEHFLIRHWQD